MNLSKYKIMQGFIILILTASFTKTHAQNASINILSHNAGIVKKGDVIALEITINNTDPYDSMPAYKLRPQISVPVSIVSVATSGHILPDGWEIVYNKDGVVRISNGTDKIPPNTARTILINLKAEATGGPYKISGNMFFSTGESPGTASGPATIGDNTADNTSSTTCTVTAL